MPVIEPEDKPRKKALFTARVDPGVVEMLRAYCVPQPRRPGGSANSGTNTITRNVAVQLSTVCAVGGWLDV